MEHLCKSASLTDFMHLSFAEIILFSLNHSQLQEAFAFAVYQMDSLVVVQT